VGPATAFLGAQHGLDNLGLFRRVRASVGAHAGIAPAQRVVLRIAAATRRIVVGAAAARATSSSVAVVAFFFFFLPLFGNGVLVQSFHARQGIELQTLLEHFGGAGKLAAPQGGRPEVAALFGLLFVDLVTYKDNQARRRVR